MSFDNQYPNRKDCRKPYFRSGAFDRSCRPGGSCPWCIRNRQYRTRKREPIVEDVTDATQPVRPGRA